jgi:hypothetical protein
MPQFREKTKDRERSNAVDPSDMNLCEVTLRIAG